MTVETAVSGVGFGNDDETGADRCEGSAQLGRRTGRIERHRDHPGPQRREVGDHEQGNVAGDDADP